ncbi:hypothetical protein GGF32_001974 [Allomyces javanicus]|nr:hypothetical protein GGF32_001974 [Allomyces javanicus]
MSAAKRRSAANKAKANAAPVTAAASAAATKTRVLLVARDRDGTPVEHQLLATSPADVFTWVRTHLHLDAHAFALLCDGMLLAADVLASALPRPATAATPLRIDLLRYHEPSAGDDVDDNESDFDVEDQDDLDPAATDINDDLHAAVLLTLVEMFPDLPARALADVARVCGTQIDDAVDMAMALLAVDDDDSASASPSATSSSSSLATNSTSSSPPTSASADDAWHAATAARHKTRRRKKPPLAPPASPASPALTREVAALLDLFPHVPASTLATHLARHANDVQAAAESLLANPPPPAQPACDGACIDAGFPCLDHGSLLPGPPSSAAIARAAPPPLPAPTPRDPRLDALRDLFPDHQVAELRAALRAAGGDSARAAAALMGDPVAAGNADVLGDNRPSWARAAGGDDEDSASRRTAKTARAARPVTASVNAFEALASPKDARRVANEHGGFTRVTAKKNKGKNAVVPGTRAVSRREREYRSEAAIKAETTILDPLPVRRRAVSDGPTAALGPAPQRASVSSAAAAMEAKLGALYAARADRFAAAARAVKSKAKYGRVGGEVATVLADHGHELTAAIRAVERDQALAIVQARQETTRAARDAQRQHVAAMANDQGNTLRWASYVPQSVGDIHADLHGLTVFQARAAVPLLVHDWYERETRAHPRPQRPLFLVVGLGKHSSGQHKLGPAVLALVRRMGFRYVDETQQFGRIVVVDAAAGGPVPLEEVTAGAVVRA